MKETIHYWRYSSDALREVPDPFPLFPINHCSAMAKAGGITGRNCHSLVRENRSSDPRSASV